MLSEPEECGQSISSDSLFISGPKNDDKNNPVGHWPWMASLGYLDDKGKWRHQCGATILNSNAVLTAAHCVNEE